MNKTQLLALFDYIDCVIYHKTEPHGDGYIDELLAKEKLIESLGLTEEFSKETGT